MVRPKKSDTPAREKILRVANELFYCQGYHQTGTNQIIHEAEVSKATFYAHFPSKEMLGVAYVQESARRSVHMIRTAMEACTDPIERYLMFQESIRSYLLDTDFRGCNFSNIAREFPEIDSPVRQEVIRFENEYRDLLFEAVESLFDSDRSRYEGLGLSAREIADRYYVTLEGAINAAANFHAIWPLEVAAAAIRDLVRIG